MLELELKKRLAITEQESMQKRFANLCDKMQVPSAEATIWYQQLTELYNDTSRHYHNMVHIYNLLKLLDKYIKQIKEPLCFEIAIWYHDIIYKAKNKNNEAESALLAKQLWELYLNKEEMDLVMNLINSTAKHQPLVEEKDVYYFLDFDLGILGTTPEVYELYKEAIWQEYKGFFPKLLYNIGRKKVLKIFLGRKQLFFTEEFYSKYEKAARSNIKLEIELL